MDVPAFVFVCGLCDSVVYMHARLCAQVKGIAGTRAKRTQATGGKKDSQVPVLVGLIVAVGPQGAGGKWTMTRFIGGLCFE